jgi:threonine synthase
MLNYHSTRNHAPIVSSATAILHGLAPDGGLYLPEHIPQMDVEALLSLDYAQLTKTILGAYLNDLDPTALHEGIDQALARFDTPAITPVTRYGALWLLELTHGPTAAFKDVALTVLPHLMNCAKKAVGSHEHTHILTATSGDTGSAALAGFAGVDGFNIDVFYPSTGISVIQQRQMTTVNASNVRVAAINGNFDDAQRAVKAIFTHADRYPWPLSSANSINIGRLLPQIVYYVSAYVQLRQTGTLRQGQSMDVCVPSGNFGNILAAYFAKLSGVPIERLICASNANHVLTDFLKTGRYDRNRSFAITSSPSMDILISSNLERLLALTASADHVTRWMEQLNHHGFYQIDETTLRSIQQTFVGEWVSESEVRKTIAKFHADHQRLIDPHTAVAVAAAKRHSSDRPLIIAETASPFKFPATVLNALRLPVDADDLINLQRLETWSAQPCPPGLAACLRAPIVHPRVLDPDTLPEFLLGKEPL